jgi:hypothetical protein
LGRIHGPEYETAREVDLDFTSSHRYAQIMWNKIDKVRPLLSVDDTCLVIPPYQRPYEWSPERWQSLVRDIVDAATSDKPSHFIGVSIISESKQDCVNTESPLLHRHIDIIDGQQRLLTIYIWLQAISGFTKDSGEKTNTKLVNIFCQETDIDDLQKVIENKWVSEYKTYKSDSSGLMHAYTYFRWILWLGQMAMLEQEPEEIPKLPRNHTGFTSTEELYEFWNDSLVKRSHGANVSGTNLQVSRSQQLDTDLLIASTLDSLNFLVLQIFPDDEDPADIFNALNGQRVELDQFDHLRNFVFANIKDKEKREELYEHSWKNVEREVVKLKIPVKGSSALDTFLYDLLISLGEKKYQSVSKDKTARQFTKYYNSSRNGLASLGIAEKLILPNLISWASVKNCGSAIRIGRNDFELPLTVQNSLKSMEWMSSGPVVPLLLNLINRFYNEQLGEADLKFGINRIESFLARFIISGQALNPLRSSIMNICGNLGKNYSLDKLAEFLRNDGPTDADLRNKLLPISSKSSQPYGEYANIYETRTSKQLLAIFQGIEKKRGGEHCPNLLRDGQEDELTIDHIFPQAPDKWKADLKTRWNEPLSQMEKRLHTIGNLAVVPKSINSDMSNESFSKKKEILSEYNFQKLSVNEEWQPRDIKQWTSDIIDSRAESLVEDFISIYSY